MQYCRQYQQWCTGPRRTVPPRAPARNRRDNRRRAITRLVARKVSHFRLSGLETNAATKPFVVFSFLKVLQSGTNHGDDERRLQREIDDSRSRDRRTGHLVEQRRQVRRGKSSSRFLSRRVSKFVPGTQLASARRLEAARRAREALALGQAGRTREDATDAIGGIHAITQGDELLVRSGSRRSRT